jgi:hypothetical protein
MASFQYQIQATTLPGQPSPGTLDENLEHIAQGLDRLIQQYKGKPRIEELLRIYLTQIQELETALSDLHTERTVDTAIGTFLDRIGKIVGQERQGLSDTDYRLFIKGRIAANRSSGEVPDFIRVVRAIEPALGTVEVVSTPPASVRVTADFEVTFNPFLLLALLIDTVAAGVRLNFVWLPAASDTIKRFGDTGSALGVKGFGTTTADATPNAGVFAGESGN